MKKSNCLQQNNDVHSMFIKQQPHQFESTYVHICTCVYVHTCCCCMSGEVIDRWWGGGNECDLLRKMKRPKVHISD